MNLAAGSNLNPASKLAIARQRLSGLALVLLAILLCGIYQAQVAASAQNGQCLCGADQSLVSDGVENSPTGARYETELTGFAEIDAPGRKTSSTRVIKNHHGDGNPIGDDHKIGCGLPRNLLGLTSLLPLPIADSRPSVQDFEVRLQV
jgi:hypothetical protein